MRTRVPMGHRNDPGAESTLPVVKTLAKVLEGAADANIRFNDLRSLLAALGFTERIKGSHHIFTLKGTDGALNLQPDGARAKAYQVKQVRQIIIEQGLASDEEDE